MCSNVSARWQDSRDGKSLECVTLHQDLHTCWLLAGVWPLASRATSLGSSPPLPPPPSSVHSFFKTPQGWSRKWQPTPVFLPGKSHGQRSLAGYSPWGCQRAGHALLTEPAYMQCIIHTFYCCVKQLKIFLQRKKRHLKEMTQVIPPTGASVIYATSLALSLSCLFHCSYKKQSVNS